jgi:LCP family protein required for cell wall assembly
VKRIRAWLRSPWLRTPTGAAFLSFLFPGLGLVPVGSRRRAALVAAPFLVFLGLVALVAGLVLFDRRLVSQSIFESNVITAVLLVDLALLVYRLWAIADSYVAVARLERGRDEFVSYLGRREPKARPVMSPRLRRVNAVVLGIAVVALTGTHLAFGAFGLEYRSTISCVFNPDAPCWFGSGNLAPGETAPPVADETGAPDDANATLPPTQTVYPSGGPTPVPTDVVLEAGPTTGAGIPIFPVLDVSGPNTPPEQWRDDGLLNVLLVGVDSGVGRWSLRPDTMILLQVELSSGRAVMYGIPRNLENVPLPPEAANAFPCHCFPYPNLLNGLWRDAVNRPKAYPYPGSDFVRGFKALEGAIGQYLGLHVDGAVVINLMGFVHLIDALGGLDIYVPKELKDNQYQRPQDGRDIKIDIKAGQQHMDGYTALAYARSRHQDSDYGRMARQQAVLIALRAQLHPCELVPKIPSLISALGSAFWTDMPVEDAGTLAGLAERVGTTNIKSVELTPSVTGNPVGFLTVPRWATVRNIVLHGLDDVTPASGGGNGGGGGGFSC